MNADDMTPSSVPDPSSDAPRRRISWELVGILAIVAFFLVMFLVSFASRGSEAPVTAPASHTLDEAGSLTSGVGDDGRPYLGSADAPIVLYQFADFQCPHCKAFLADAAGIHDEYVRDGRVRLEWVNFPTYGDESYDSARSAVCARDQGRFWEMHDWLYANQGKVPQTRAFTEERLLRIAAMAELDLPAYRACMAGEAAGQAVKDDEAFATENGVTSTPSFMVGDRVVSGNDVQALRALLDDALAGSG